MNMNIQRCVNMNMNMHRCVHCEIIMIIDYYLTKSLVKREDSNLSMHNYVINFVTQSCDISLPDPVICLYKNPALSPLLPLCSCDE